MNHLERRFRTGFIGTDKRFPHLYISVMDTLYGGYSYRRQSFPFRFKHTNNTCLYMKMCMKAGLFAHMQLFKDSWLFESRTHYSWHCLARLFKWVPSCSCILLLEHPMIKSLRVILKNGNTIKIHNWIKLYGLFYCYVDKPRFADTG